MKIIKVKNGEISGKEMKEVIEVLKKDQVIVVPTDTIYGFSCAANSKKAVSKIHKIKGSKPDKPLIVLVSGIEMLSQYAVINENQKIFLKKFWPNPKTIRGRIKNFRKKPLTVILEKNPRVLKAACANQNTIAVRLPNNELNYTIIRELGEPLVSTSLNISGKEPIDSPAQIEENFSHLPDLIIDSGISRKKQASKLIDIRDIDNIKILRN